MFVIGITGSLGAGKTTVASMFAELGAKVFNADKIVHKHLKKTGACYKKVIDVFGNGILCNGNIDRGKLADIVFTSKGKLKKLVDIVHPEVDKVFISELRKYKRTNNVIILDVPLLFESKENKLCDKTIVVKAPKLDRIQRAVKHLGITRAEAIRRINMQMPQKDKVRLADIVINNKKLLKTNKQVGKIWQELYQQVKK